jgi:hypothetical protein
MADSAKEKKGQNTLFSNTAQNMYNLGVSLMC